MFFERNPKTRLVWEFNQIKLTRLVRNSFRFKVRYRYKLNNKLTFCLRTAGCLPPCEYKNQLKGKTDVGMRKTFFICELLFYAERTYV